MKKVILFFALFYLLLQSCSSQIYVNPITLQNIVDKNEFTFAARRAHPTGMDAINVINSLPNTTTNRVLDLDQGYGIVFKNQEMEVTLPYFGRVFNPSINPSQQSLRFTSKDFSIIKTSGKKESKIITIKPNDVRSINQMYLEIFKNGAAYLSISANDRQPISFDGYISVNETPKK